MNVSQKQGIHFLREALSAALPLGEPFALDSYSYSYNSSYSYGRRLH